MAAEPRLVVDIMDTEEDQSGTVEYYRGKPLTGLSVGLSEGGEITSLAEIVDGRAHGYAVDYRDGQPISVDEYDRGTRHGIFAKWEARRLSYAARLQYGVEDQVMRTDGTIEDLPEGVAKVARLHARQQALDLHTDSVADLLARFERRAPGLLQEARLGMGLP